MIQSNENEIKGVINIRLYIDIPKLNDKLGTGVDQFITTRKKIYLEIR